MTLHAQALWEQGFVRDGDGNVAVIHGQPTAIIGQVGALNEAVVAPVYGMASIAVMPLDTGPTLTYEASFDGGSTWVLQQLFVPATQQLTNNLLAIQSVQAQGELSPGCTHFRARVSGAGTPARIMLLPSSTVYRANQLVTIVAGSNIAISQGSARIGAVGTQAQGFYTDETTTPLAAAGTFTGVARDLTLGAGTTSVASAFKEIRGMATADVAGTLHLEVSGDQVTWWRIISTPMTAVGALFYAQLSYAPVTRYARFAFTNGAAGQSAFLLSTSRFAA